MKDHMDIITSLRKWHGVEIRKHAAAQQLNVRANDPKVAARLEFFESVARR